MKKTNLLPQGKPNIYEVVSTPREIYETENCFQLKVEDSANVIQLLAEEHNKEEGELVHILFEKMKNYRLYDILEDKLDSTKYDVNVRITSRSNSRTAHVKISKRSVRKKIREGIKSFISEHVG